MRKIVEIAYFEVRVSERYEEARLVYTGEKPTTIKGAWKITEMKWFILSVVTVPGDFILDQGDSQTCGLCMLFSNGCSGCPISSDGHPGCVGDTPYRDYLETTTLKEAQQAARAELKYLRRLKKKLKKQSGVEGSTPSRGLTA